MNLTARASLLDEARQLGLNLSQVFEAGLERAVRTRKAQAWLDANREALEAYNEHIAKHGVFSDGLRSF